MVYTANDKNFKSYIGLGSDTIKGEWVTITRNLKEDLRRQDPTNKIVAINGFAIRGDGRVSNVHMLKVIKRSIVRSFYQTIQEALLYLRNKNFIHDSIAKKEVKTVHINSSADNKSVPTITLINGNTIYLNLGKKFIDPGVIAKDSNGEPLDVELIGDINTSAVNSYPLHYLAIDKNGNATSVTRMVVVLSKDTEGVKVNSRKESKTEDINSSKKIDESKNEEKKELIEKELLEELYQREMEIEGVVNEDKKNEESNTQKAIDNIFQNAEGDTHEEKLQNIAIQLEELMDKNK